MFKRSLVVPVKIEGPEDFLGLSRAGLEVYINELLTQRGIAEKFFCSLEGQVSRVSVIVGERDLTFYVTFQDEAVAYESELREQIPFIIHYYLRPLIENVSIPNNDCKVYFVNPAPVGIYTRNLFMDELGLKINDYGTNFVSATDSRRKQWESEKLRFGFDNRETWCLDTTFVEWLYSHLKMYLDVSIVDIDVEKMEIVKISNGQLDKSIMSLRDIATYVTEACQTYLLANCNEDGFKDAIDGMTSALHIWAQAFYRFNW